jgi:hypothetical protein
MVPGADASIWSGLNDLKARVLDSLESRNDGVRSHVIKFLQTLVLLHSFRDLNEVRAKKQQKTTTATTNKIAHVVGSCQCGMRCIT